MSTLKTHNLQSPDAGSVNIAMTPNSGVIVTGISTFTGNIDANGDLDVDGHTNLDNVSVAGVSTFTGRIDASDNIAITSGNRLYFGNSDVAFLKGEHGGSGYLSFGANTEHMRLTRAGRLGIGTDNPQKLLELQHIANRKLQFSYDDNIITIKGANNNENPETIRLIGGNSIRFHTGATGSGDEKLRITSGGQLYLGPYKTSTASLNVPYEIRVAPYGWSASQDIAAISMGNHSGSTGNDDGQIVFKTALNAHTDASALGERMRIDSSGRVVVGGSSSYIGGAALAVLGTGTTPNTYGSFAIGKVGANPTAGTTLANIRLNGGSVGTRRGAEINAVANGNWTDGSSQPTKLVFAVANVNSASATQRYEINHYGHHVFTNENVFASSSSPGTNSFKGLSQHGYQHWGQRQYYSGQQNLTQNGYFDLFSNNTAHDDIIFWLNIKGFHGNRTFATAHGAIGGYGLSVSYQSASGVYGAFSGVDVSGTGGARRKLRWTSTSPYTANWWIWGWISGTSLLTTHTGYTAAQLH